MRFKIGINHIKHKPKILFEVNKNNFDSCLLLKNVIMNFIFYRYNINKLYCKSLMKSNSP